MRFHGLITDLDNTLYDFSYAQHEACRAVIRMIGLGCVDDLISTLLFSPHGVENHAAISDYLLTLGIIDQGSVLSACTVYEQTKKESIRAYPGVVETIIRLYHAGITIAAVTNAGSDHARKRIAWIDLEPYIHILISPDISGLRKPDPAVYLAAAEQMALSPSLICVIGDNRVNDIAPALSLGMFAVYARYGDRLPPEYAGDAIPDATVDSFDGILDFFLKA